MSDAVTREETLLNAIATGETVDIVPITRKEKYLRYLAGIGEKPNKPITREEMFLDKIQAGGGSGGGGDEASVLNSILDKSISGEFISSINTLGGYTFYQCKQLEKVKFTNITELNGSTFYDCDKLSIADFPKVTALYSSAFAYCELLKVLILRNNSLVNLTNTSVLKYTAIASGTGYIYVPSALIDTYKSATNWSNYASQFRALEDYTVDGTITGELDESKI